MPDLADEASRLAYVYGIGGPRGAKKQKKASNEPTDLSAVEAAAKKAAKESDAKQIAEIGSDPEKQLRNDGEGTGLLNLGATCYMNSLLQCLHMNVAFRQGIYQWRPAESKQGAGKDVGRAGTSDAQAGAQGQAIDVDAAAVESDPRRPEEVAEEVCHQLQLLFANLQHSALSCYDPAALTSALSLDVAVQQDAQEFNKLLLSFLEEQLKLSPEPKTRDLVQSNFRGWSCYHTQCRACQRASESSSNRYPFYELELNVRPTLQAALEEYVAVEELCGSNQYECDHCKGKRDATRQMALIQLPPVLCLQLLRFVYDPMKDAKKKVSDPIEFPEYLDAAPFLFQNGENSAPAAKKPRQEPKQTDPATDRYRLTAVLMHTGSSAHSGHYTARILEQSERERWMTFNDEVVFDQDFDQSKAANKAEANGVTLLKRPAADGGRLFASRNAYMLLYTRVAVLDEAKASHAKVQAPLVLRGAVEAAGQKMRTDSEEYKAKLAAHTERVSARQGLLDELLPIIGADGHDGRWVDTKWLQRCLTCGPVGKEEVGAIDNTQIVCAHGEADPQQATSGGMKLISPTAWQRLHTIFGGGPELRISGCTICADAAWKAREKDVADAGHKAKLASALAASTPTAAGGTAEALYYAPKQLQKRWPKWLGDGKSDATSDLFCAHGKLLPLEAHARIITKEAWSHVLALFPQSTAVPIDSIGCGGGSDRQLVECDACRAEQEELDAVRAGEKASAKSESDARSVQRQRLGRLMQETTLLDDETALRAGPLYLLDAEWLAEWRLSVLSSKAERPGPLRGACCKDHGRLLIKPELCVSSALLERIAQGRGGVGADGNVSRRERERDKRLGARGVLVSADEVLELSQADSLAGCNLPRCELRDVDGKGGGDCGESVVFATDPDVCETCANVLATEVMGALLEYSEEPLHVRKLVVLPTEAVAATGGGAENGGAGSEGGAGAAAAADGGGSGASSSGRRRSSRASAGSNVSVVASSSSSVLNLKMRIYQATDWVPSQQRLFVEGAELADDAQTLHEAAVLPNSTVHVFVDTSRPSEMPDMDEVIGAAGGGKQRVQEDGFVGSALVSSTFGAARSSSTPPAADAGSQ